MKPEIMSAETEIATRSTGCLRHIVQGAIATTNSKDIVYTTILGAGVLVCLHDPIRRIGGAAHFLFPEGAEFGADETRFGGPALTALILRLIGLGADPAGLEAKLFGGAKLHDGRRDLGQRNVVFALRFLKQKDIPVLDQAIGGDHVRRLRFCPMSGQIEHEFMNAGLPQGSLAVFGTPRSLAQASGGSDLG